MNIFNVITYSRMPTKEPLTDIISDKWKNFGYLRNNQKLMKHQPMDIYGFIIIPCVSISGLIFWNHVNVTRFGICYIICLHIRTLLFTVTNLPPPCIGFPKCPCANVPYSKFKDQYSIFKIAMKYTLGGGVWYGDVPQCGDLTMSGHTIYNWTLTLFFLNTISNGLENYPLVVLCIKIIFYTAITTVTTYIILIRNHYTIDIVLAVVYVILVWNIYGLGLIKLKIENKSFLKTTFGRFMNWAEKPLDEVYNNNNEQPEEETFAEEILEISDSDDTDNIP